MKILKSLILCLFVVNITLSDGKQSGSSHQHIVREAYKRLKLHLGYDIPELWKHLGDGEEGTAQFTPGNKIVIGAYREDEEDIVFDHTTVFHSCTHFWQADNGDGERWNYSGIMWENAYEKANKFIYGGYTLRIIEGSYYREFQAPTNLFDYYKTGLIYQLGLKQNGVFYPDYRWVTHSQTERDKIVWEIIGRVAHLLADVNTPAHVKHDPHPIRDNYEDIMKTNHTGWNYLTAN